MQNRLFLLALVAVLLLMQAVLRSAFMATPFSSGETLGGISFWELRGAIPLGIFAAGLLLLTTAAAALTAQAATQLTHGTPRIRKHLSVLAAASLWCGIPTVAGCLNALPYIFPWLLAYDSGSWQTQQHLEWTLHGSMLILVICHIAGQIRPAASPWLLPLPLLCLLALGQMGFNQAFILVPTAIMSAAGILMLLGRGRRWAAIPLLTGVVMNGALLWLTANPIATIPAASVVYTAALLLLGIPFYLKATQNHH